MILTEAIDEYVARKRANGLLFHKARIELFAFSKHAGDPPLYRVNTPIVLSFLDERQISPATWRHKYRLLKAFFEFWSQRGAMPVLVMPPQRPTSHSSFVPYIYTRGEIRSLLRATRECQRRSLCVIDPLTFRCLILTLYATGALLAEVLDLRVEDIDFKSCRIALPGNRVSRPREIAICSDLQEELRAYVAFRGKGEGLLFLTKAGQPILAGTLEHRFLRLRSIAGIARHDGAVYQPRMHDLRSTFAVHRISSWIKDGSDLNRMLPALAAYMGNVSLAATEKYLSLTPERFRRELKKLSPQCAKRHWRDDPALMRFLGDL